MVAPRKGAYAEESAEVEVLFANMDKMASLTKKLRGALNRLDESGHMVQETAGPIFTITQKLQTTNNNIDRVMGAIERLQAPRDQSNREERIIKAGPQSGDLQNYMASMDRMSQALAELKRTNLRANQQNITEYSNTLQLGTKLLEDAFRDIINDASSPVYVLEYAVKEMPFPTLSEKSSTLRLIHQHISASSAQLPQAEASPTHRIYVETRGAYIMNSLRDLAEGTLNTAKKKSPDALYQRGAIGIGTYAQALQGLVLAEHQSICPIFSRNEWGAVFTATCQAALGEFIKILRDLNGHIQKHLMTDCFLGYEIVDIVGRLSAVLEKETGELKQAITEGVKPIRETSKASLGKLLDDTRTRVQSLVTLSDKGDPVPVTTDTMARLQAMTDYLAPLSSIMTSLGPGGWSAGSANSSSTSIPFDVGADGKKMFADYATETIDILLNNLELKSRTILRSRSLQGIFMANNLAIIERRVQDPDLQPLLGDLGGRLKVWHKKGENLYMESWRELSAQLMDKTHTNKSGRPHSGSVSGSGVDSTAVVKGLGSKDKESIKERFKNFNAQFDTLVAQHRQYVMEREVRAHLTKQVQSILEPLYGRFWDRYHEIDKGKGKYVKYDKNALGSTLANLANPGQA